MSNKAMLACCLTLLTIAAGCQLALPQSEQYGDERFVGFYLATEWLDWSGAQTDPDGVSGRQHTKDRVYAQLVKMDDGASGWEYIFPAMEGIPFFVATIRAEGDRYRQMNNHNGMISDVHLSVHVGPDEGTGTTLEGTVYVAPGSIETIYVHTVHQSPDGSVYLIKNFGYSLQPYQDEGMALSLSHHEASAVTENGETGQESLYATLSVFIKYQPVEIRLIHMNGGHTAVLETSYTPPALPETIAVPSEAAYLIVETVSAGPGGETVSRRILQEEEGVLTCHALGENGVFIENHIEIIWE